MGAERLSAGVAVEERRENPQGKRRRKEKGIATQHIKNHRPHLARSGMTLGNLGVVLGLRRLRAGRDAAVDPFGAIQDPAGIRHLVWTQKVGDSEKHNECVVRPIPC